MIADSRFVVHDPFDHKGKWKEVFGNTNPVHIEIGMGKGRFIRSEEHTSELQSPS